MKISKEYAENNNVSNEKLEKANTQIENGLQDNSFGSLNWLFKSVLWQAGEVRGSQWIEHSFYPAILEKQVSNLQNGTSKCPTDLIGTWYEKVWCRQMSIHGDDLENLWLEKEIAKLGYDSPIALLNTSILTDFGDFDYKKIDVETANEIMANRTLDSAVGHQATADIMTEIFDFTIPMNRQQFKHKTHQKAIVFKLRGRPEEGKILTRLEIEEIGYDIGLLIKR